MAPLALIAQIGLPVLAHVLGGALGRIDSPAAKTASKALDDVAGAFARREIDPAQIAEANRHLERMAATESAAYREAIAQINRTFRTELQSDDAYVRRWRPTFGYAVAFTWVLQVAGLAWAVIATPERAGEIIAAMTSLSVIWGVALSVLGINVAKRSQDKAIAAGITPPRGLGRALLDAVSGPPAPRNPAPAGPDH